MRLRVAALLALLTPAMASAQIPLGPQFRVNTFTTSSQIGQAVAADGAGNFVVAWQSYQQDGSGYGVFARRHLASGAVIGPAEFRVNGFTPGYQWAPSVAADASGGFAVVWMGYGQDGSGFGIFGRRYDEGGTPGPEFRINERTTGHQSFPKVAMGADGGFVAVWAALDGSVDGVFARRYDAAGVPQGGEFRVNSHTPNLQQGGAIGMDAAGNFVVAWTSEGQDSGTAGIFAQRYDAAGSAQGTEFRVNGATTGDQRYPVVAMAPGGAFLVVWNGPDGDNLGVFARSYDASGAPQGGEFQVNQATTGTQFSAAAIMDPAGHFVIAWTGPSPGGASGDVVARLYDASGAPLNSEFRVNEFTTGIQAFPALATQPGGRFVVSWNSNGEDGDFYGVFARRFAGDVISRDGFESGDLSGWSSASVDGGDLNVSTDAAMKFTIAGLQAVVDDTAGLFVEDALPEDEDLYRARFYFDTNGFDPGEGQGHRRTRLFLAFEEAPNRRVAAIVLRRLSGVYGLMARARLDDGSQYDTGFFPIDDGPHAVELAWSRASDADASDGSLEFWIDGVPVHQVQKLDNRLSSVDFVRMGALSVKTGATGTLYFDEFESRRLSEIGP